MTQHYTKQIGIVWLLLAVFQFGCSKDGKYPVSGTVTWDDNMVVEGNIVFTPTDESLAPDAGFIVDGTFRFRASPGAKKVEIFAVKDIGKPDKVMNVVARTQYIPARYNEKTELTADVDPDGENEFVFDLTAQKGDKGAGM